jgi:predicted RNase H-like nuclease (RuvC/YqgF family)
LNSIVSCSGIRAEIAIAFLRDSFKKAPLSMTHRESAASSSTPKSVAGLAILLLVFAAFFGFLNTQKVKALRVTVVTAQAARDAAERRIHEKPNTSAGGTQEEQGKVAEAENRAAKAEAELAQTQKERADLQAKLDENQKEIASLKMRGQDAEKNPNASTADSPAATAAATDLQSQLDDLRNQLDSAEKEKAFLSEKLQDMQERADQPKQEKKRREAARESGPRRTGLRGTVLAVNQAYNFVVLNLGARHGVESNAEMLVLRDGALIGKIRISSVEPATAIGDIMTNSLARGAQMQPGDNVIYAGTSP